MCCHSIKKMNKCYKNINKNINIDAFIDVFLFIVLDNVESYTFFHFHFIDILVSFLRFVYFLIFFKSVRSDFQINIDLLLYILYRGNIKSI